MSCCCAGFCAATDRHFNARVAARELRRYRRRGPQPTTKLLRDGLRASGFRSGTVLDVGAGIGALTFELLQSGASRAVAVDASAALTEAGRGEAARRGLGGIIEWRHADFVSSAEQFAPATVVTLDRVVCCYPAFQPLLAEAARRAERFLALSYPRELWRVRAGMTAENAWRALVRNPFRTFIHPAGAMEAVVQAQGLHRASRATTPIWCVDVYVRT